jgi:hypothetical protein
VWRDLSFLDLQIPSTSGTKRTHGILKSHISIVIIGSDPTQWAGFCFIDDDDEEAGLEEAVSSNPDDLQQFSQDPIAGDENIVVDADLPIFDPRVYFVMVVQRRIAKIHSSWRFIVDYIEQAIDQVCRKTASFYTYKLDSVLL